MQVSRLAAVTALFGAGILLGRILGAVRDVVIVRLLGFSPELDGVVAALSLPEAITSIAIAGPGALAFVPILTATLREEPDRGRRVITELVLASTVFGVLVAAVLAANAPTMTKLMWPGLPPEQLASVARYVRVSVWLLPLTAVSYVCMPALQATGLLALSAFSSAIFNGVLVGASLLLVPMFGAIGVIAAAICAAGVRIIAQGSQVVRAALIGRASARIDKRTRCALRLLIVAAFCMGLRDLLLITDRFFVSFFSVGAIASLTYAERLTQAPFGFVVGGAVSALVPLMSGDPDASRPEEHLLEAVRLVLPPILAVTAVAAYFPEGITWILFGKGTPADLIACLRIFALGLPVQAVGALLTVFAFVRGRPIFAVWAAAAAWLSSTALSQPLSTFFGPSGLALANVVGYCMHAFVLAVSLNALRGCHGAAGFIRNTVKAAALPAVLLLLSNWALGNVSAFEAAPLRKTVTLTIAAAGFLILTQFKAHGGPVRRSS